MASGIKAIYDDEAGVFKPTEPVDLKDKTEVEVLIPRESTGDSSQPTGWAGWDRFIGAWTDAPSDDVSERHDEHLYD